MECLHENGSMIGQNDTGRVSVEMCSGNKKIVECVLIFFSARTKKICTRRKRLFFMMISDK